MRSGNLLPLNLGDERPGGEVEATYRGVLEPLGHELESHLRALELVEEHSNVILVAGESVDGVRDDHVGLASSHWSAKLVQTIALQCPAARGVANASNHTPPTVACKLDARPLLRVEGGAVALLCVGRHS